jgi:hypothetical protein
LDPSVYVFFYGSYMNRSVLAEVGLAPTTWEVASLPDFEIQISGWRAALCYIAPHMAERAPDAADVERILRPAREMGFPRCVQRLGRSRRSCRLVVPVVAELHRGMAGDTPGARDAPMSRARRTLR